MKSIWVLLLGILIGWIIRGIGDLLLKNKEQIILKINARTLRRKK